MSARQIDLRGAKVSRASEETCAQGEPLRLRPQQRVSLPSGDRVVVLREGMIAVDAMPAKGKLQVLDFLVPGDVISACTVLPAPRVSLRAITSASLAALEPPATDHAPSAHGYWMFLVTRCFNQLARVNVHQLMIGRLETEERVASFILALALRSFQGDATRIPVPLPMSRDDIANYLVMNCDTLSRIMMRFCESGLLERESRHSICVTDLEELKRRSPMSTLISAVFSPNPDRNSAIALGHYPTLPGRFVEPAPRAAVPLPLSAA
jgi:CRP/FNR family transcriptional regulator, anaerobic regulatory protein